MFFGIACAVGEAGLTGKKVSQRRGEVKRIQREMRLKYFSFLLESNLLNKIHDYFFTAYQFPARAEAGWIHSDSVTVGII